MLKESGYCLCSQWSFKSKDHLITMAEQTYLSFWSSVHAMAHREREREREVCSTLIVFVVEG